MMVRDPLAHLFRAYLDDVRTPPDGWVLWRSYDEAVAWMTLHGCPGFVSLDHDLGVYTPAMDAYLNGDRAKTGMDVVRWMIERDRDGTFFPDGFAFTVHSMNPVGRERMLAELGGYLSDRAAARGGAR